LSGSISSLLPAHILLQASQAQEFGSVQARQSL
jgi:hypothetical protein